VAREEAVVLVHASARHAAAREDIVVTSMSKNSSNEDSEEWDCAICPEPINLNDRNVDTFDNNASVVPGVRTAQRSAALMVPGVPEHEREQLAVAREEAVVPEHASARHAAAREDLLENR
jgi:hypothetical protein